MQFALVDNTRVEPQPKQQGLCPNCFQSVIAKCGSQKIWHWAHRNISSCDSWWEPETEWHRNWKNKYPSEWQEIVFFEKEINERHIADIRTIHNLVIEFQHSAISPEERMSREKFYKEMIWVIDGTRLKHDYTRFSKAIKNFKATEKKGIYLVENIDDVFPTNWLSSSMPVIFDFKRLSFTKLK